MNGKADYLIPLSGPSIPSPLKFRPSFPLEGERNFRKGMRGAHIIGFEKGCMQCHAFVPVTVECHFWTLV